MTYPNRFDRQNADFDRSVLEHTPTTPDALSATQIGRALGYQGENAGRRVRTALMRLDEQNLVQQNGWTRGGWPLWSKTV